MAAWPIEISMESFNEAWTLEGETFWRSVFEMHKHKMEIKSPKIAIGNLEKIFSATVSEKNEFQLRPLEKKATKETSIMWGTYRSLINNAVVGVSAGHEKILDITGVGFRANLKGDVLNLQLGFSHDINFKIPKEIKITVEKQTILKITGIDKELVSKTASDIKAFKPVEPYKGKGIKERNQFVLRKEGKKK